MPSIPIDSELGAGLGLGGSHETPGPSLPSTPPPSLIYTSSSPSYTLPRLLSLAPCHTSRPVTPPQPRRLSTFAPILRHGSLSTAWGVDESISSILSDSTLRTNTNTERISIPKATQGKLDKSIGDVEEVMFRFSSLLDEYREERQTLDKGQGLAPRVMVDFQEPFNNGLSVSPPMSEVNVDLGYSAEDPPVMRDETLVRFGQKHITAAPIGPARAPSPADSERSWRRGPAGTPKPLNAFGPPWPLPSTTPVVPSKPVKALIEVEPEGIPSLPPPPSSLPSKPNSILPPVFVRRESAALPQPMKLDRVAPLGRAWEGDSSLSGNEKRRRDMAEMASGTWGNGNNSIRDPKLVRIGMIGMTRASAPSQRPERLVKLGERLRESVSTAREMGK